MLLAVALACILLGAFIAARPVFDRSTPPAPGVYILNGTLGALMVAVFVALLIALGTDILRCDVLGIANCD